MLAGAWFRCTLSVVLCGISFYVSYHTRTDLIAVERGGGMGGMYCVFILLSFLSLFVFCFLSLLRNGRVVVLFNLELYYTYIHCFAFFYFFINIYVYQEKGTHLSYGR